MGGSGRSQLGRPVAQSSLLIRQAGSGYVATDPLEFWHLVSRPRLPMMCILKLLLVLKWSGGKLSSQNQEVHRVDEAGSLGELQHVPFHDGRFCFMILKLLVPQWELLPKDDTKVPPQTAATKAVQSIRSEKHRKHLENRTRTVGFEYLGRLKKENKASSWKTISGA